MGDWLDLAIALSLSKGLYPKGDILVDQKTIIESLAMGLKRVALGLHKGSNAMANRFKEEAQKRESDAKL